PPSAVSESEDSTLSVPIKANVRWLACSDAMCVPGDTEVKLEIPFAAYTTDGAAAEQVLPKGNSAYAELFTVTKALQPKPLAAVEAQLTNGFIELQVHLPNSLSQKFQSVQFFPEHKK